MRDARPWLGFLVGFLLGLAIAVMLQQAGAWPLDQVLVFVLVGLFAFLGSWLGRVGRESVGAFSTFLPMILAVAMIGYGAIGIGNTGETGNINGGCLVQAQSDAPDQTDVFDTSRGDPFDIDPNGGLSWVALSPGAIMDHHWAIYVEFAGFDIQVRSGSHPNKGGSEISAGDVADLSAEIQKVTFLTGQELRGTFIVSGDISVQSGVVCDGFAFVRLTSDGPFESLASQIAAALAVLMLLILLTLFLRRSGGGAGQTATAVDQAEAVGRHADAGDAGAAGAVVAGAPLSEPDDDSMSAEGDDTDGSGDAADDGADDQGPMDTGGF